MPLTGVDDLLQPFVAAFTPRADFRVGTEAEKFGIVDQQPVAFEGQHGVASVLERFVVQHGWNEGREHPEGPVISLTRDGASITLEPAAQLELSGAPFATVHETRREFDGHLRELGGVSTGIRWLSAGFHPLATHAELPRVPKLRYGVMERYMPTRGPRAQDMMRRTCTVQANLDYSDEADAMRKLRLSLAIQPIVTAMFANSPFVEGRVGERLSERADVWLKMDPDRSGLLPFAWAPDRTLEHYVQWALDVPMFMLKRNGEAREIHAPFREFLAEGAGSERATMEDWKAHLASLFPEARLKNVLEVRGADAQSRELTCALPALWKGLLYDDDSMDGVESLVAPLTHATVEAARPAIATHGLRASLLDRPVQGWAEDVFELARAGLARQAMLDASGRDETVHLQPLGALLDAGLTPADAMLAKLDRDRDLRPQIIELTALSLS